MVAAAAVVIVERTHPKPPSKTLPKSSFKLQTKAGTVKVATIAASESSGAGALGSGISLACASGVHDGALGHRVWQSFASNL